MVYASKLESKVTLALSLQMRDAPKGCCEILSMRDRCNWKAGTTSTPLLFFMPAQLNEPNLALHLQQRHDIAVQTAACAEQPASDTFAHFIAIGEVRQGYMHANMHTASIMMPTLESCDCHMQDPMRMPLQVSGMAQACS